MPQLTKIMESGNWCFKIISFSIYHAFIVYISYTGIYFFFFSVRQNHFLFYLSSFWETRQRNFNPNALQKSKHQSHSAHPTLPVISLTYSIFRFLQVFLHIVKWLPHFTSRHNSFLLDAKQSPYFSRLC